MNNERLNNLQGNIIDGSGRKIFFGKLSIENGKITDISEISSERHECSDYIAPGFIDIHSHGDHFLLIDPSAASKIQQGVTTDVIGNCGYSAAPINSNMRERRGRGLERFKLKPNWESFGDYLQRLEEAQPAVNVCALVGHGTLRTYAGIPETRAATPKERLSNLHAVKKALEEGAFGLSTGTFYVPGSSADKLELLDSLTPVSDMKRLYAAHIRNESDFVVESLYEAIDIARIVKVKFQYSHIKAWGYQNWNKANKILELIKNGIESGIDISTDLYPYDSAATELISGMGVQNIKSIDEIKNHIQELLSKDPYWNHRIRILSSKVENFRGKRLFNLKNPAEEIARILEADPHTSAAFEELSYKNIDKFISQHITAIGSDSSNRYIVGSLYEDFSHPRAFGTFPRFISKYTGEGKLLSLEEGIRRVTSLPAERLGLTDRGLIKIGMSADLVIFDPSKIKDKATFQYPKKFPIGIKEVWVNGKVAVQNGIINEVRNGKVLRA